MDVENGQSSSSSVTMENEVTKLVRVREGVETQIKLVQNFLDKPSDSTNSFLKTIFAIIKRSKEQQNIDKNESASSDSSSIEKSELEQLKRFVNSVKGAVDTFTILKDEEGDENLGVILTAINWITRGGEISVMNEETSSSSSLLSSKNTNHHENSSELDSKRQKVALDAESNENTVELFRKEESPLENNVILKLLFKMFDAYDLLHFRPVSRKWNSIATTTMNQLESRPIVFVYNSVEKTYKKSNSTFPSLSEFNKVLSKSKNFPTVIFQFCYGDLASLEARKFFKTCGKKIQKLFLCLKNESEDKSIPHTSVTTFRTILLEHARNLEWLELWSIPDEWCEELSPQLFPEPRNMIQLPKLTTLIFEKSHFTNEKSHRLAQDLIQAAVNLKTIIGYKIEYLDPSASALENKIHTARDIDFVPTRENLDLYSKFSEGNPKLTEMYISLEIPKNNNDNDNENINNNNDDVQLKKKVASALQMILESSKDTLTSIIKCPPLSYLPSLKFPEMEKMNVVSFTDHEDRTIFNCILDFQGIPRPLQLNQMFPSLETVTIDFQSPYDSDLWLDYFDYSQPLDSVKNLCVEYETFPLLLEKLGALFPAVEKLEAHMSIFDFRQTMAEIWKGFSKVKDLNIEVFKFVGHEINREEMDSGITGFSPETCLQLRNNSKNVKLEDVEALREYSSICDATKLSSFKIQIKFEDDVEVFSGPIFSIVTGVFGFDLVKKMNRVNVECAVVGEVDRKLEVALSKIPHYVKIVKNAEK